MGILKTLTINGITYNVTPVVPASSITLLASAWVGNGDAYSQVVEVPGVTANTKVDLQPTSEQLAEFHYKVLAFVAENDGGVITVYAIGDKPTGNHTIQITKTEVEGTGKIRGNTVGTTMPRPDWNQTDPTQSDYIKNKPDLPASGGASALIVTESDGKASHTVEQICDHVKSGGVAYFLTNSMYLPIVADAYGGFACAYHIGDDGWAYYYEIYNGNEIVMSEFDYVRQEQIVNFKPLFVTVKDETASHNSQQIYEHIQKGGSVYIDDGGLLSCTYSAPNVALFNSQDEGNVRTCFEIDSYGTMARYDITYSLADDLGDIDTALDRIIEIQNSLIGGDA